MLYPCGAGGGEFCRRFSVSTYQISIMQLSKYSSTQRQIRLALKCRQPTPLEAITTCFKDDFRFEKKFENSLRYSDAISKIQNIQILQSRATAQPTRTDASGFSTLLKINHLHREITTLTLPDLNLSNTDNQ